MTNKKPPFRHESYRIALDAELVSRLKAAIELEQAQLAVDPQSNRWLEMQDELAERLEEIGNMIIWEFKQLPF